MLYIKNKASCSGCHACMAVCPQNCISMTSDEEGFLYPEINADKCIDCGLCEKACQYHNPIKSKNIPTAYAAYNKSENIRMQSSSGGVFTLIAEYILGIGGTVFGAAFNEELNVCHIAVDKKEDLYKLRGSKYIQSVIGDSFEKVKIILNEGKPVLFTGTPCQCDGLLHYLNKSYDNLYIQDIICHGVPSSLAWQKYLDFHILKNGEIDNSSSIKFRNKDFGWKNFYMSLKHKNGQLYQTNYHNDLYMKAFLKNVSLRLSCYNCKSKTLSRNSDITLADFWGIKNIYPEFDDDKGTSLVFINSQKGEELLKNIEHNLKTRETPLNLSVRYNKSAYKSVTKPKGRRIFYQKLSSVDFKEAVIASTHLNTFERGIVFGRRVINALIRRLINK